MSGTYLDEDESDVKTRDQGAFVVNESDSILSTATTLLRLATAALLLLSGFSKLLNLGEFGQALRGVLPVRVRPIEVIAIPIIAIELGIGSWLAVAGRGGHVAAWLACGLFVVFALGIAWALLHHRKFECGCFGRLSRSRATWITVGRNLILAVVAAFVAVRFDFAQEHQTSGLAALLGVIAIVAALSLILEAYPVYRVGKAFRERADPTIT